MPLLVEENIGSPTLDSVIIDYWRLGYIVKQGKYFLNTNIKNIIDLFLKKFPVK